MKKDGEFTLKKWGKTNFKHLVKLVLLFSDKLTSHKCQKSGRTFQKFSKFESGSTVELNMYIFYKAHKLITRGNISAPFIFRINLSQLFIPLSGSFIYKVFT